MLWVLKRTVSLEHPKHMFKLMDKKIIAILRKLILLNWTHEIIFELNIKFVISGNSLAGHNGKKFSTRDNDNDLNSSLHCAEIRGGGWWYSKCGPSSLNGKYITHNETSGTAGIRWIKWKPASYSFKSTEMRIRRA